MLQPRNPSAADEESPTRNKIYRLNLSGPLSESPILSQVEYCFDVRMRILRGLIYRTEIGRDGELFVEILGTEPAICCACLWLTDQGAKVELMTSD
ncbi:MAG TPA: NIL domain-containing protein [Rectinemataceae bacterium]|nr:NIL domain-containing protein [Rectinemataceae bacterium]